MTRASGDEGGRTDGFDHGLGHPLLLLCDAKDPNCRKNKAFKDVGHYSEWPKVADAVIKAERMITKFGSLFAGNVDLDHIGLEGTPVNDRWLSNEHLATVFDKCQAMAQLMDRLGYDPWWAAEHHFQREGYECIPNLLMLFVHAKSQIINRSSPSERRATAVKI